MFSCLLFACVCALRLFPAEINLDPSDRRVAIGSAVEFFVMGWGNPPPLTHQWYKDGVPITNATNWFLSLPNAAPSDAGGYSVALKDAAGAVTSKVAILEVELPDPLDYWHWRQPVTGIAAFDDVAYGNGIFVILGNAGTILSSSNAVDWSFRNSGTAKTLHKVAFVNGQFVAAGEDNTAVTSTNGIEWVPQAIPFTLAQGNGLFMAAKTTYEYVIRTYKTVIYTSVDGAKWNQSAVITGFVTDIAFGQGSFVAVGLGGTIWTSRDGVNWVKQSSGTANPLIAVVYGNNRFVAIGSDGYTGGEIVTSNDGVNWTKPGYSGPQLSDILFAQGMFLTVGYSCTLGCQSMLLTSVDGLHWVSRDVPSNSALSAIAYGKGTFIVVDRHSRIITSSDGVHWRNIAEQALPGFADIAYGAGTFVAVGSEIATSTNSFQWKEVPVTPRPDAPVFYGPLLTSLAYANGTFIAVGQNGTILLSTNTLDWTSWNLDPTNRLVDVVYGDGLFVTLGQYPSPRGWQHRIFTSPDGMVWTLRESPTNGSLLRIAFGNHRFVAVGQQFISGDRIEPRILTSVDGVNWVAASSPGSELWDVAFGQGVFVAIGGPCPGTANCYQEIITSTNGLNWDLQRWQVIQTPGRIVFEGGSFIISGNRVSRDGMNWSSPRPLPSFAGMAYGNGALVAVGAGWGGIVQSGEGGILQSDPLLPTPPSIVIPPENQNAPAGAMVTLRANAIGSSKLSYQWLKDGLAIPGATDRVLTLNDLQPSDTAHYSLRVTNAFGTIDSNPVKVDVETFPSARAQISINLNYFPELTLSGTRGRRYQIQYADDLDSGRWTPGPVIIIPPSPFTWIDPVVPLGRRFYRAAVIP